ncbi:MAG: hypothetical protein AMJ42_06215 [Deltaproteobacteria bacterium DG_8]|nr:MAG: hypothetical protein AMJ42_06215 [Deltaproteobacteria bacterium DG_8]
MKKKILVVDDDFKIRTTMAHILEYEGYSVSLAEDGISALRSLGNDEFDVLITDIRMPTMDGIELFNHVKKLYPQMQVIFITGSTYINTALKGLEDVTFFYFEKPVNFNLLICALEHIFEIKKCVPEVKKLRK